MNSLIFRRSLIIGRDGRERPFWENLIIHRVTAPSRSCLHGCASSSQREEDYECLLPKQKEEAPTYLRSFQTLSPPMDKYSSSSSRTPPLYGCPPLISAREKLPTAPHLSFAERPLSWEDPSVPLPSLSFCSGFRKGFSPTYFLTEETSSQKPTEPVSSAARRVSQCRGPLVGGSSPGSRSRGRPVGSPASNQA